MVAFGAKWTLFRTGARWGPDRRLRPVVCRLSLAARPRRASLKVLIEACSQGALMVGQSMRYIQCLKLLRRERQ
jgi:hypothetical protein